MADHTIETWRRAPGTTGLRAGRGRTRSCRPTFRSTPRSEARDRYQVPTIGGIGERAGAMGSQHALRLRACAASSGPRFRIIGYNRDLPPAPGRTISASRPRSSDPRTCSRPTTTRSPTCAYWHRALGARRPGTSRWRSATTASWPSGARASEGLRSTSNVEEDRPVQHRPGHAGGAPRPQSRVRRRRPAVPRGLGAVLLLDGVRGSPPPRRWSGRREAAGSRTTQGHNAPHAGALE